MVLPRSEGRIEVPATGDPAGRLCELVAGAERIVRIFSDALAPELFDNQALASALSQLARSGRQCEVRILIRDSELLVKRAHRLGALHRRLLSVVQIRKLGPQTEHQAANYVLVDDRGIFFIPMEDDKVCFMNHEDRPLVRHYTERFDDLWARSGSDPELRVLPL